MTLKYIITPQVDQTLWVRSLILPQKSNGTLRVCLYPKHLKRAIIHEHLKTFTLEEITHKLAD